MAVPHFRPKLPEVGILIFRDSVTPDRNLVLHGTIGDLEPLVDDCERLAQLLLVDA